LYIVASNNISATTLAQAGSLFGASQLRYIIKIYIYPFKKLKK